MAYLKKSSIAAALAAVISAPTWAEQFVVSDIRVEGLQRISAGSVFATLPLSVSDNVDSELLRHSAKMLFATGNFDDIQIGRDGDVLVLQVVERPSISDISIEGNKAIDTDALLEGLKGAGLAEGKVLKRSTLEGMRLELQRQYVSQGRYDATIETEVQQEPRNRVSVHINVNEGSVARISHINIVGNTVYSNEELLDNFTLQSSGMFSWISGDDKYSKEKLQGDIETLQSYYLDRGYINYRLESSQVSITPDRKSVYITINVDEGDEYTVDDVELSGDLVIPAEELNKFLIVQKGQVFSQALVTRSEEYVTQRLGNAGYTFAKVRGITDINEKDKTVSLKFFVDPGKRAYVRRISFSGNTKTKDEVLRREMRQMEASAASTAKIEQGRHKLEQLGFFKGVTVDTKPVPGSDDLVDVAYSVEEQPSGSIGASIGYAQGTGMILGANVQQNNFMGTGNRVGVGVNFSSYQRTASYSYVNPYYTEDQVSRGFSVYYRETNLEEINVASYSTNSYGASMNFGYPIKENERLGFSLGYQNTHITTGDYAVQEITRSPGAIDGTNGYWTPNPDASDDAPDEDKYIWHDGVDDAYFQPDEGPGGFVDLYGDQYDLFKMSASWSQSTLNRGQLATRGHSQSLSVDVAVPGSDLQYYKISYNGQYFVPLSKTFTLRFRGELGYGDGYGSTEHLPFFENYYAGGFGSVRGFKNNTLGPRSTPAQQYAVTCSEDGKQCGYLKDGEYYTSNPLDDDDPFGGNVLVEGSMELIFPAPFVKDKRSLRTAFFIDAGNVYSTDCYEGQNCLEPDLAELRYSAGVGLTWITGFGPLTFSLAKPLNEGEDDDTEVFQFSLGQSF
ncbi:outer membrane protein assembly factor BamA [Sinobacterium caligoides]|nr:outer membrane protein assembly factor BamA [Sinobacterium caligoides]